MLMKDPERFERTAREWAVKHAGAPQSSLAGSSKFASKPKKDVQKTREELEREMTARYVLHCYPQG